LLQLIIINLEADPGDRVEVDEPIAQIETDKVSVLSWSGMSIFVCVVSVDHVWN